MYLDFYNIALLLGSFAFFLFGMKMMSEGTQKVLGDSLRKMIEATAKNRISGIFSGLFSTALIQSSTATTVVTVSLVNAGLLTLLESGSIILGANVGTTATSWLIAVLGFKTSLSNFSIPLIALGVPFLFTRKKKIKFIGEIIVGFAIVFWGLSEMKNSILVLKNDSFLQFLWNHNDTGLLSSVFFILIGAIITFSVQSSAATIVLTQTLCFVSILPIESALAVVLGANLGSVINSEITALAGNVHAKRAARIHSLFNGIGLLIMLFLLSPLTSCLDDSIKYLFNGDSIYTHEGAIFGIAFFHSAYNIANVVLMVGFLPHLVKLATKTVKSKGNLDEEYHLEFMDSGLMTSPEISIAEAKKELVKFAHLNKNMNDTFRHILKEQDADVFESLILKMRKQEDLTDNFEEEITTFLTKVSQVELTEENSFEIHKLLGITVNLEQVGDIYYGMALIMERKKENKVWFIQEQRDLLNELLDKLDKAFEVMIKNLNSEYGEVVISDAREVENEIDALRDRAQAQYFENMETGLYSFKSGMYYKDLFSNCERIGDYIIKTNEEITDKE